MLRYHIHMIEPIGPERQQEVLAATERYIGLAETIYLRSFPPVAVNFNLKGSSAGMFQVKNRSSRIRYNPWLFAKYYEENLTGTVPHEVAHYVVHCLYGLDRVKPHGQEWLAVMTAFDADPSVTGDFDLTGIPTRTQRRFRYHCGCREHEITTRRHNVIQAGRGRYECRLCRGELHFIGAP